MIEQLQQVWESSFPGVPPVRHILRKMFPDRWLRVHGLPSAQRLPTSMDDERELLRRHDSIAQRTLSSSGQCAIVSTYANGYRGEDEPGSVLSFAPTFADAWASKWSDKESAGYELEDLAFAVSFFQYAPGTLDALALDVAHGRAAPLVIFAIDTRRVYSPYDGGADLFFENSDQREAAKIDFRDWLSHRGDGL